jgi:hypothetical protein
VTGTPWATIAVYAVAVVAAILIIGGNNAGGVRGWARGRVRRRRRRGCRWCGQPGRHGDRNALPADCSCTGECGILWCQRRPVTA